MKRRLMVTFGIVSPFLLIACTAAIVLVGVAGWLLLNPEEKSRLIKIAPVGPLPSPAITITSEVGESSAEPTEESVVQSSPEPAAGNNPLETKAETAIETENYSLEAEAPSDPASNVEEGLGYALPPGSVSSVTQEGLVTRLVIPTLNLDAPAVMSPIENQTWKVDHLGQAIGHLEGTAPPGSDSNLVLAGHVTLAVGVPGPFAQLGQLAPGDLVVVYEGDQKFEYVVDSQQTVDRTAVEVTYPSESGQITLITCQNWNDETGRYDQRLVIKGHLLNS